MFREQRVLIVKCSERTLYYIHINGKMKSMFFSKKTLCSSYPHWPGALLTLRSRSFMEQTCWLNWIMQLEHVTLRQQVWQMPRVTVDVSFLAKKYESIKIDFGLLFLKIHFLGQYQQRNETSGYPKTQFFAFQI